MTTLDRLVQADERMRLDDIARPMASRSENLEQWHRDRASEAVTASEVHRLLRNYLATRRPLLTEKLFGATFGGTKATARGNANEEFWIRVAMLERGTAIVGNDRVFASLANDGHRATPDGFEHDGETLRGVEVKDHHEEWVAPAAGILLAEHYSQIQWNLHVFGLDEWVYVVGFSDADGNPSTTRTHHIEVVRRNDAHILELVDVADRFLAWWAQGAPEDEISDELRTLLDEGIGLKATLDAAQKDYDAWRARLETEVPKEHPGALATGWANTHPETGTRVTIKRGSVTVGIDEDRWAAANAKQHAAWRRGREALATVEADAKTRYPAPKVAKNGLVITIPKQKAKSKR